MKSETINKEYKCESFYNSMYYIGSRPFIWWVIAVSFVLLYPATIVLMMFYSDIYKALDKDTLTYMSNSLVALIGVMSGLRTTEKVLFNKHKTSDNITKNNSPVLYDHLAEMKKDI